MRWLWTIPLMLWCSLAYGTTRYVAASSGTFSGGSACNGQTAITVATFNSTAQSAGDINYLCGTLTASAGASNYIVINGAGSSGGGVVSLIFDTNALVTATYWGGCAITLNSNSYILVNGGSNGTIQATANGTGLANTQDNGVGICSGGSVSNVEIKNVTVSNMYQHTCTEPVSNCTDQGAQDVFGIELFGGSNLSVHNNTVHDMKWAIFLEYGYGYTTSTNFNVYNNTIYNMDHGVVFGDYGFNACSGNAILSSSNSSSAIYNNDFSAMQPWDATGDVNHHDAVHLWANCAGASSSHYTGVSVYSNYFHGAAGATCNTIFGMESTGNGNFIFNNIANPTGTSDACSTGMFGKWTGTGSNSSNHSVFNNTISPSASSSSASSQTLIDFEQTSSGVMKNNLLLTGSGTYVYTDGTAGDLSSVDYDYYQTPAGGNPFYGPSGCNGGASFSTWKGTCGFDTHGANTSVTVNAAPFTLPSGSAAIGAGTNLTSLGITALDTGAPQTFGASGSCGIGCLARPSSGPWDMGAYQSSGGGPTPFAPTTVMFTGLDYNQLPLQGGSPSNVPTHGLGRIWDSPCSDSVYAHWVTTEISNASGAANTAFNWTCLDTFLSAAFSANVPYIDYVIGRTPQWAAQSNSGSTECAEYNSPTGSTNECMPPTDLNSDGTGTNLIWRNWVAGVAAHVNATSYKSTHAYVKFYEIWNEPEFAGNPFWLGSFDQLIRMSQDAYCIIKGSPTIPWAGSGVAFTVTKNSGESCLHVRQSVDYGAGSSHVVNTALFPNFPANPIDLNAFIVMPSYHANTGSAWLVDAQGFLYCTGRQASGNQCIPTTGTGSTTSDIINFHMKPGNDYGVEGEMEEVMSVWHSNIESILQPSERSKPLFGTEGGYNGTTAWAAPYVTTNTAGLGGSCALQAGWVARYFLYGYALGISSEVWYMWKENNYNAACSSFSPNAVTAAQEVASWVVGSTGFSCSPIPPASGLFTCSFTTSQGNAAIAAWYLCSSFSNGIPCSSYGSKSQSISSFFGSCNATVRQFDLAGNITTPAAGCSTVVSLGNGGTAWGPLLFMNAPLAPLPATGITVVVG